MNGIIRKAFVVLFFATVLLGATSLTEFLFYRQDAKVWVEHIEDRLHKREVWADRILASFGDTARLEQGDYKKEVLFLGFRQGKIFFWSNRVDAYWGLYQRLMEGNNFIKLRNTYYEVRHRREGHCDYFALLKIKDVYPYNSQFVQDRFADYLKIAEENVDLVDVHQKAVDGGYLIKDKDGKGLFYLTFEGEYKDLRTNYVLIAFYLIFFLSLFYVYDLLLQSTNSWRRQLVYLAGFVFFLLGLRWFMLNFQIPSSVYRLPIFANQEAEDFVVVSVGDLLLTALSVFYIFYITSVRVKINYACAEIYRNRYLIACLLFFCIFIYVDFYNFAIHLLVKNMDIQLNMAQLIHISTGSVIAFIAICLGGLVILFGLWWILSVLCRFFSFRQILLLVTAICVVLWGISALLGLYTNFWDCFFIWGIFILMVVGKYLLKFEIQRGIYILLIFLLSIYVVMVSKKYEHAKEQQQRVGYATELIEERDYNFEQHLVSLDNQIVSSDVLPFFLSIREDEEAKMLLREDLIDMSGFDYYWDITFCREGDRIWLPDSKAWRGCREYFDWIIQHVGYRLGNTHFYAIRIFDGFVTYVGRFYAGNTWIYLRFDADKGDEGVGYPQLLSRKSSIGQKLAYHYSYAKYSHGRLVASGGDFIYSKKLKPWAEGTGEGVRMVDKDDYSHMLIAVDDYDTLIISLPERTFALYYVNTLYAFFICILFSSYGLLFDERSSIRFMGRTLKTRIKNSVISLIFLLFLLLTALSIFMNVKSFEARHEARAFEFLRYVNKELERMDCVNWEECPDIVQVLANLSEQLMVDVNIYAESGELVATSRPEIFQYDFHDFLMNPRALQKITKEGGSSYMEWEKLGELKSMAVYMPLVLDNGKSYVLSIPYFAQNDELNMDIMIAVVIAVNIAIIMMVIAFVLSGLLAERVIKPLQLVNDKLRLMRAGGKNEKISYKGKDELAMLVQEYNNMVDKVDESIRQLALSERESAWREMARQIAHEIKNPLTPMKLNIQFMLRSLQVEDIGKFKQRFKDIAAMLMEQIDNLAATASAFSDFAKLSVTHNEVLNLDEVLKNCILLFENNIDVIHEDLESGIQVLADREQMRRVIVNLLKNAEQSIPEGRKGEITVTLHRMDEGVEIRVKDNGCVIPEDIQKKIFEPNFTTKSSGSGLGLAICRSIIENFGGKIGFTSEEGIGTEFYIILDEYDNQGSN